MTTPDEARQARKTAMVQEAVTHMQVAGHVLNPMAVRTLERLYDTAEEDGRQRGIAQTGIMLGTGPQSELGVGAAIVSELAKLSPGHAGLTLGELATRVQNAGWDVSRMNVRHELFALIGVGLVGFSLPDGEQTRYAINRPGQP
jgi:hypothetical protein